MKKIKFYSAIVMLITSTQILAQNDRPLYSIPYDYNAFTDKTIEFSPDCKMIAHGTLDGKVKLFNIEKGTEEFSYKAHSDIAICVKFSPDGNIIASGGKDGSIMIYDLEKKDVIQTLNYHSKAVMCLSFSPDGKQLFSGSRDNSVKVYDFEKKDIILNIEEIKGNIRSIQFNPDGKSVILATSALTKGVRMFRLKDGAEINTLESPNTLRIDISPNGFYLAAASLEKNIKIFDLRTNTVSFVLEGFKNNCSDITFSPQGKMLASAGEDKIMRLWDIEKGTQIHQFSGHEDDLTSIAYSNDGTMIATAGWDNTLKIWDIKPYTNELVNEEPISSIGVTLQEKENEIIRKAFQNLEFKVGSSIINESSFASLDELATLLINKKECMILIEGHTDNVGQNDKNLALSIDRANAVKMYLLKKGVEEKNIFSNGYGSKRPIADNNTEIGRQKNRRVELKIVLL